MLNGFDRQVLLRESYENTFSIFDHDNNDSDPIGYGLVVMHDKENIDEHGILYNAIRRYHANQIHKEFGLTLTEFYDLPKDQVELIFRLLGESRARADASLNGSMSKDLGLDKLDLS